MNDESHPHFCDCADCLDAGGGVVLEGMGVVRTEGEAAPRPRGATEAGRPWLTLGERIAEQARRLADSRETRA